MDILFKGAEAVIYRDNGKIIKERIEKRYRIKELDEKIRKTRTRREASLLSEARRRGVNVPKVLDVEKYRIIMEYIEGYKLKHIMDKISGEEMKKIFYEIGKIIGRLHSGEIIHGDLTTSNILLKEGKIYLIDFGLGYFSNRTEDFAMDLLVLKESINAAHSKYLNVAWNNIIKGYKEAFEKAEEVIKRLEHIEMRGRYVKRD